MQPKRPSSTQSTAVPEKKSRDEEETEGGEEWADDSPSFDVETDVKGVGPEQYETKAKWSRPPLADGLGASVNVAIDMQVMDIDYITDTQCEINGRRVVTRLFGVTRSGNSVCVLAEGFMPYFYAQAPDDFNVEHIDRFRDALDRAIMAEQRGKDIKRGVIDVSIVEGENIYGFRHNKKQQFLKIIVSLPRLVTPVRHICERAQYTCADMVSRNLSTFEANIDYDIRFMVDTSLTGCGWMTVPAGKYKLVPKALLQSRCQLEITMDYKCIVAHAADDDWSDIAPVRILSYDIECAGRKGIFPVPEIDRVIQIANIVQLEGDERPIIRNVFTLNTCAPIVGTHVMSFKTEAEMLQEWASFVRQVDPDIITGYNIQNFDMPYLLDRAKVIKAKDFCYLGRAKDRQSAVRTQALQSKQMGNRVNKQVNIEGRVTLDLLQILLRDHKLRSYTLNSVSYHFLQEQKEDVQHTIITDLQEGDEQTRRRLAVYCVKDAHLPMRLLRKLMCVVNYMEMARVTGVPLAYLLSRGQQVKVISQLMRKAKEQHLFLPVMQSSQSDESYEGATVIEPKRAFYNMPIATLDFASLYPSIMMAHNLCYTTLLNSADVRNSLSSDDYIKTPSGNFFVKASQRKGLLPQILEDLLTARKKAKTELKSEKNEFRRMVLDGRQLALKISANSVYGFTGATVGKLPCLEISQSVTGFGRQMIEHTKNMVEEKFTKANGYPSDADVIYGDTDSVMVKFGVETVAEAMALGAEAATFVSQTFVKPIRLEFEKVYCPYLLINKKRYAGLYFTRPDVHDKMDCKGIETVRRDSCPLVASVLNTVLHKLLIERSEDAAVEFTKRTISDLLCNRIDISNLIISKELTKTDKEYANKQAHCELANRMRKRDAGSAPRLGDRVPYVIVCGSKGAAAYTKAEDPIYVLQNSIPIDTQYYLDNQLSKPLMRIFEPVMKGGAKEAALLLKGDHTRTRSITASKVGGLSAFTTKSVKCLGCKAVLKHEGATCEHCAGKEAQIYHKEVASLNVLQQRYARLWTECQRCQGSVNEEVLCTARDCPIFYMRTKVKMDLQDQTKVLDRFGDSTW